MDCQFCNNTFSSLSVLTKHQKNTRYCLSIQNKTNNNFKCMFCEKIFTSNDKKNRHHNICKELNNYIEKINLKNETMIGVIEEKTKTIEDLTNKYESRIKDLQDQLIDIIKSGSARPNIINQNTIQNNTQRINNIINNLVPMTDEHLREQTQFLTIEHIKQGVDGYVQYALEHPFKDRIICVDFSRRKIKYKDQDGNIIDDPDMAKMSQKFFKTIEESNTSLINSYLQELYNDLMELNRNPNNDMDDDETLDFDNQSTKILDKSTSALKNRREVREAANGSKPEMYFDFIKTVCSKIVK